MRDAGEVIERERRTVEKSKELEDGSHDCFILEKTKKCKGVWKRIWVETLSSPGSYKRIVKIVYRSILPKCLKM